LAGRSQCFMNHRRYRNLSRVAGLEALGLQAFVSVVGLLHPATGAPSAVCALRPGHLHHSFGGAICLPFVLVSRPGDRRFRPYHSCYGRMYRNPAEIMPNYRR